MSIKPKTHKIITIIAIICTIISASVILIHIGSMYTNNILPMSKPIKKTGGDVEGYQGFIDVASYLFSKYISIPFLISCLIITGIILVLLIIRLRKLNSIRQLNYNKNEIDALDDETLNNKEENTNNGNNQV